MFRISKKYIIVFLVLLSFFSVAYIFININKSKKTPPPVPKNTSQATYKSIVPGISTSKDLSELLGNPVKSEGNISEYTSLSPNRNNKVSLENDTVSLVKEIVTYKDNKRTTDIIDVYGVSEKILYGPDAEAGFFLFIYPSNGLAYIGNPIGKTLLEIWYFPPTDITTFKGKYASEYADKYTPKQIGPY